VRVIASRIKGMVAAGVGLGFLALLGSGLYGAHRLLDRTDAAGYQRGLAEGAEQCQAADVARLDAALRQIPTLTAAAQQASRALEQTIAARRAADQTSTRELRHALAQSAAARADCVLPADVVQQLAAARAAAARAAAAGVAAGAAGEL